MSAAFLIGEALTLGVHLSVADSGRLKVRYENAPPPPELIAELKAAKWAIIDHLRAIEGSPASAAGPADTLISKIEAGEARRERPLHGLRITEGLHRLATISPPHGFSPSRWACFQDDAAAFNAARGERAAAIGWSPTELYGLSRKATWGCWRGFGLVPMLNGSCVASIDVEKADIRTNTGARQIYRRRPPWPDAVPAWELA